MEASRLGERVPEEAALDGGYLPGLLADDVSGERRHLLVSAPALHLLFWRDLRVDAD